MAGGGVWARTLLLIPLCRTGMIKLLLGLIDGFILVIKT